MVAEDAEGGELEGEDGGGGEEEEEGGRGQLAGLSAAKRRGLGVEEGVGSWAWSVGGTALGAGHGSLLGARRRGNRRESREEEEEFENGGSGDVTVNSVKWCLINHLIRIYF